jgi:CubicO group peptidase (beta-lactamase class C family)
MPRSLLLTVVPMLLLFSPAEAQRQSDPLAGLDGYITGAVKDWNVPGLSIAVVKGDSIVFAKGYGVRELGKADPVTPNTLFAIGSNSKSFTAAAIGMLVDEGKMRWDDRVTKFLPGFQLYDPYVTRELTIRDVLSHRSGLGRRADLLWIVAGYPRAEVLRRIRFLEPNAGFRTEMGYQNIMFLAAGEAAGAAAGATWDELVTQRVLGPLGMTRSNTSVRDLARDTDVAQPHSMRDSAPGLRAPASPSPGGVLTVIPWRNIDNIAPAGSINSSVMEMSRYLRFINAGGTFEGKQLLKPATLGVITTPHTILPVPPDTLFPSVHFRAYGLGWGLSDYHGRRMMSHSGGIDGMLSWMYVVPEEKLGIMILTNGDNHSVGPGIGYRILDSYLTGSSRDWNAIMLAQFKRAMEMQQSREKARLAARAANTRPSRPLSAYAGVYADSLYGDLVIRLEGDRLVADLGPHGAGGVLEHWQYDSFRLVWRDLAFGKMDLTFTLDRDGTPSVARIDTMQDSMVFRRRPENP